MPIEVMVDDEVRCIEFLKNFGWIPIQRGEELTVDTKG
jgi:hypothetical protein